MKKLLSVILLAAACGSLASCGSRSGGSPRLSYWPPLNFGVHVGDPGDQSHYQRQRDK